MKIIKYVCLVIIILCSYVLFNHVYNDYNNNLTNNIAYKNKLEKDSISDDLINSLEENKDNLIAKIENEFNVSIEDGSYVDNDDELNNKYDSLLKEKEDLKEEQQVLEIQYNNLLNSTLEEPKEEEDVLIEGVPTMIQYPDYPTGCESVALTILLNYYGYNITPDDVISKLKLGLLPYMKDDVRYGGNPEIEFIGNPYEKTGYGVYEMPILEVTQKYNSNFVSGTGKSLDELLELVDNGVPSIVWVSSGMCVPYISKSWIYEPTNETIYWKKGEHAVVLIGYNSTSVIVSDPDTGNINYYDYDVFNNRYEYFGRRNIFLNGD